MSMAFDHSGSSFDSFLEEEGILDEVEAETIKRVLALDRLLDPENSAVHLQTIARAARAVGKRLRMKMIDAA